jgi:ABC-type nitrate/sulfonate/bicarbonate transport system permease component
VEQQPDVESIGELLGRLVEDGKGYAQAELGYYRTLARSKLRDARASLWMGAVAIGFANAAIIALIVGMVLTLSPLVGPGLATLIVVLVTAAIAGIMARLAWLHVKKIIGEKP